MMKMIGVMSALASGQAIFESGHPEGKCYEIEIVEKKII